MEFVVFKPIEKWHDIKMVNTDRNITSFIKNAKALGQALNDEGFEVVSWHEGTTPRDLFGYREVWQDEGGIKSGTKKGPTAIAITEGRIVIHDEYTAGSTRAQLSAKAQMNARVGQETRIPGFNGEVFTVEEGYGSARLRRGIRPPFRSKSKGNNRGEIGLFPCSPFNRFL